MKIFKTLEKKFNHS